MNSNTTVHIVLVALFAALIAVGTYLVIYVGPVPITLQGLFVLMTGLILGPFNGTISVAIYLLLGTMGLPLFAGGGAGLAAWAGPTGGYLLGFLLVPSAMGLILRGRRNLSKEIMAVTVGSLLVLSLGVTHLTLTLDFPLTKALAVGALPFLIGDALKAIAAVTLARSFRYASALLQPSR